MEGPAKKQKTRDTRKPTVKKILNVISKGEKKPLPTDPMKQIVWNGDIDPDEAENPEDVLPWSFGYKRADGKPNLFIDPERIKRGSEKHVGTMFGDGDRYPSDVWWDYSPDVNIGEGERMKRERGRKNWEDDHLFF